MKDLEKIKSEDLGCQVADANPGNFAIEQEVAQLVGATVPAPSAPSADDARELGAQLLVFLRRALLPIRSAMRTAVAAIYAHLDSRCTDYTPAAYASYIPRPYDPMTTPRVPRTLPNLLTAITAFDSRKISNGSAQNDGIPDGTSLAHLLCEPASVVELKDDNYGWTMVNSVSYRSVFANCVKVTLGCTQTIQSGYSTWGGTLLNSDCEYHLPKLKKITPQATGVGFNQQLIYVTQTHDIYLPELEEIEAGSRFGLIGGINSDVTDTPYMIYAPKLRKVGSGSHLFQQYNACKTGVWKVVLGTIETTFTSHSNSEMHTPNLIHFEFGEGTCANLNLSGWNPTNVLSDADKTATFLQNFKEHIALRLTDQGSGKTLTLSQAVFDTIWNQDGTPKSTDPDSVIYQINKIIKTDKHWSVNRA